MNRFAFGKRAGNAGTIATLAIDLANKKLVVWGVGDTTPNFADDRMKNQIMVRTFVSRQYGGLTAYAVVLVVNPGNTLTYNDHDLYEAVEALKIGIEGNQFAGKSPDNGTLIPAFSSGGELTIRNQVADYVAIDGETPEILELGHRGIQTFSLAQNKWTETNIKGQFNLTQVKGFERPVRIPDRVGAFVALVSLKNGNQQAVEIDANNKGAGYTLQVIPGSFPVDGIDEVVGTIAGVTNKIGVIARGEPIVMDGKLFMKKLEQAGAPPTVIATHNNLLFGV